jgi:hypothetical protein
MRKKVMIMLAVVVMLMTSTIGAQAGANGTNVYVNGYELTPAQLTQLQNVLGYAYIPPGNYWLDRSGNFGVVSSRTGVYVNGYELSQREHYIYEYYFGPLRPGSYRLENGYLNRVTGPWSTTAGGAHISSDGNGCTGFVWSDATYLSGDC